MNLYRFAPYRKIIRIYHRILEALRGKQKFQYELKFWIKLKNKRGNLPEFDYEYWYTKHFDIDLLFYKSKKILDIGCGPLGSLEWVNTCSCRIGIDPLAKDYKTLRNCKHKMSYLAACSESLPFKDGCFDAISSFGSLDHLDNLDGAISEIIRVLAPNGVFLLLVEVNHDPTVTEPIELSWDVVFRFAQFFEILDERHYEKVCENMYESTLKNIPYDHSNTKKRSGVLSVKFRKM